MQRPNLSRTPLSIATQRRTVRHSLLSSALMASVMLGASLASAAPVALNIPSQALASALHGRDYWRSVADVRLLRGYERERKAALLPMGLATDGLQQLFSRQEEPLQALRNWGMKGFELSGPLKHFVARQAMGNY